MNHSLIKAVRPLLVCVAIFVSALSVADHVLIVPVGDYDDKGQIQTSEDLLHQVFPDGTRIVEWKVVNRDGFIYLSRKGYSEGNACRTEAVPLVDRYGERITPGSDPRQGQPVFLSTAYPVRRSLCEDDGCRLLGGLVTLEGDTIVRNAHCDITETSQLKCMCHVERGRGIEVVDHSSLCLSNFTLGEIDITYWVTALAMYGSGTIEH